MTAFNIYCDESCHLEHDREKVMVLGAITCAGDKVRSVAERLRDLKREHGLSQDFEIKWSKVSAAKLDFYRAVLDYFFDEEALAFRALIVPDKSKLDHGRYNQTHDEFYYKMYYDMLKVIFDPSAEYRVFLDIKDTRSAARTRTLEEILSKKLRSDFGVTRRIVHPIQLVRSHHVQQVQLADLLIGAVSYVNRGLTGNAGKVSLVERMQKRARHTLTSSTLMRARKVNLLRWNASGACDDE